MLQRLKEVKTVHRLDCETSGVCVLALTVEAARCLTTQFKEKLVKKTYLAIVEGDTLPSNEGEISLPIRPDYHIRPKQRIDPIEGKEARTIYRKLAVDKERGRCKMELIPYTGEGWVLRLSWRGRTCVPLNIHTHINCYRPNPSIETSYGWSRLSNPWG